MQVERLTATEPVQQSITRTVFRNAHRRIFILVSRIHLVRTAQGATGAFDIAHLLLSLVYVGGERETIQRPPPDVLQSHCLVLGKCWAFDGADSAAAPARDAHNTVMRECINQRGFFLMPPQMRVAGPHLDARRGAATRKVRECQLRGMRSFPVPVAVEHKWVVLRTPKRRAHRERNFVLRHPAVARLPGFSSLVASLPPLRG